MRDALKPIGPAGPADPTVQLPFPIDYQWGRVSGTRLRALRIDGALVTDTSDDISHHVNVPEVLGLHWKVL